MNAQNIISHRMFVAALSQDGGEETRMRPSDDSMPADSTRGPGARGGLESPGAVAQQLLLLSDAIEFQPA